MRPGVFLIIISTMVLLTSGCTTIPRAPERDLELKRQLVLLNNKTAGRLLQDIALDPNVAPQSLEDATFLVATSKLFLEFSGYPESEWKGKPVVLLEKAKQDNRRYERDLEEWREDVSKHEGKRVGGVLWPTLIPLIAIPIIFVGFYIWNQVRSVW